MAHAPAVRRQSIRVALAATLVVGVAYVCIGAVIVAFSTRDLTSQVDQRLTEFVGRIPPDGFTGLGPDGASPGTSQSPFGGRDPGRRHGLPFLAWLVQPDGTVLSTTGTPDLPAELQQATIPQTFTIDGTEMRVAGTTTTQGHMIVAQ